MQLNISKLGFVFLSVLCVLSGSLLSSAVAADKVSIALNWVPEPEFGGIYAAREGGAFGRHNLDVDIKPGGAGAPTWQQVASGKAEFGVATNWHDDGFGWTGFGAPGDSGSPVLTATGQAAGDFTHLIVDTGDYPGSDHAGTRITKALSQFGVSLVNADGTTTGAAGTSCG
jgi:hypothetical protein